MKRILSFAVAAFTLVFASVAAADTAPKEAKKDHAKAFPMSAEAFQKRAAEREQKFTARFEKRIQTLPADKASAARAKLQERLTNLHAAVAEATKDGTVTKEEAKGIREAAHPRHAKHKHGGHGHPKREAKSEKK